MRQNTNYLVNIQTHSHFKANKNVKVSRWYQSKNYSLLALIISPIAANINAITQNFLH